MRLERNRQITVNVMFCIGADGSKPIIFATKIDRIPRNAIAWGRMFGPQDLNAFPEFMVNAGWDVPDTWYGELPFMSLIRFETFKGTKKAIKKDIQAILRELSMKSGIEYYPSEVI